MMTGTELAAKRQIVNILLKEGHVTFAKLFNLFDLHLTRDPNIAAAVDINKARIIINRGVPAEYLSVLIRHEIMHRWFEHWKRLKNHIGNKPIGYLEHQLSNIAGDYDISNKVYSDKDKEDIPQLAIQLKDGSLKQWGGLITELDHPEWTKLSFEDMYDKLLEESEEIKKETLEQIQDILDKLSNGGNESTQGNNEGDSQSDNDSSGDNSTEDSPTSNTKEKKSQAYIDGFKKAIEDYKAGRLNI